MSTAAAKLAELQREHAATIAEHARIHVKLTGDLAAMTARAEKGEAVARYVVEHPSAARATGVENHAQWERLQVLARAALVSCDVPMVDAPRCSTCDRPACGLAAALVRLDAVWPAYHAVAHALGGGDGAQSLEALAALQAVSAVNIARLDCEAHAVVWRERCLRTEHERDRLMQAEAHAGALRFALAELHLIDGQIPDCDEMECRLNTTIGEYCSHCSIILTAMATDGGRAFMALFEVADTLAKELRSFARRTTSVRIPDDVMNPCAAVEAALVAIRGPAAVPDATRPWATEMDDTAIAAELKELGARWDALRSSLEVEGHGGSPGEWMFERMNELETEQKRRAKPTKRKP